MNDVALECSIWHAGGTMADEPKTLRIRLGPQGRIVIPAHFRRAMGVEAGEPLVATLEGEGRLVIETRKAAWESLRRQLGAAIPDGVDLVAELIAERRAEARREEAEMEPFSEVGEVER
jgi:AbrB family looped-hinge helix DNA binding protein